MYAAYYGNEKVVALLLSHSADPNGYCYGKLTTALHRASANRALPSYASIELLVQAGGEIDAENELGHTPLMHACRFSSRGGAEKLVNLGADVRFRSLINGQTPLHVAAGHSPPDLVQFILGCGVDVDSQDDDGRTPLHCVSIFCDRENQVAIATDLLAAGANRTLRDNIGKAPADLAHTNSHPDYLALLAPQVKNAAG